MRGTTAAIPKRLMKVWLERAETLRRRGLNDERVLEALLASEHGQREPILLKAEVFDKMNHTCRRFTDGMTRMRFDYDFVVDIEALRTVMLCLLERVPVLHSSFSANFFNPFWHVRDYRIEDVVTSEHTSDPNAADRFMLSSIDHRAPVQIRCHAVISGGKTAVCFLINHMCADGGDLMRIMRAVCKNYTNYVERSLPPVNFPTGKRNFSRLYGDFTAADKIRAALLFSNPTSKDKNRLPLTKPCEDDGTEIIRHKIPSKLFSAAREAGKKYGASANDVATAACFYARYKTEGIDPNAPLEISCAVNLRRHMLSPEETGITNYTAFMNCSVPRRGDSMEELLKSVAESNNKNKDDKFLALHGLSLLAIAYNTMIYIQAEHIIRFLRKDTGFVFSNVGAFKTEDLAVCGHTPYDSFMCGGAKNKPCIVLVGCTVNGDFYLTTCIRGTQEDRKIIERLLSEAEKGFELIAEL